MSARPHLLDACERIFGLWRGMLVVTRTALAHHYRQRVFEVHPDRAAILGRSPEALARAFRALERARRRVEEELDDRGEFRLAARHSSMTISANTSRPRRPPSTPRPRRSPTAPAKTKAGPSKTESESVPSGEIDPLHRLLIEGYLTLRQVIDARAWLHGQRPRLGSLALEEGLLTQLDLWQLLAQQRETHHPLGAIAVRQGYLTPTQRLALLRRQRAIPSPGGSLRSYLEARGLLRPDELRHVIA